MRKNCEGFQTAQRKEFVMSDARYYRAKAEFCFGIAQVLSDPVAAGQTRALANECVRRAQELENRSDDKSGKENSD
jgi:hypothetical protein